MEPTSFLSTFLGKVVVFVAATYFGQFAIKKLDSLLWTLEQPAKYCVSSNDTKDENRELSRLVFWVVLINLQLFRVITSMILGQFHKKPIEPEEIVRIIQKWHRSLRSIRFGGLQDKGVSSETEFPNGHGGATASPPTEQSDQRQQNNDKIVHYDLLEELMNRTFSDNDDLDSTFGQSLSEDFQSPSEKDTNSLLNNTLPILSDSDLQDLTDDFQSPSNITNSLLNNTLPIVSDSEQQDLHPTSKEQSFELTVGDESAFTVTRAGSTSSLTEESRTKFESNGKLSIESSRSEQCGSNQSESSQNQTGSGKEQWNQSEDLEDALMTNSVEKQQEVKPDTHFSGTHQRNKKNSRSNNETKLTGVSKRKHMPRSGYEIVNRQSTRNATKRQGSIDNEN